MLRKPVKLEGGESSVEATPACSGIDVLLHLVDWKVDRVSSETAEALGSIPGARHAPARRSESRQFPSKFTPPWPYG